MSHIIKLATLLICLTATLQAEQLSTLKNSCDNSITMKIGQNTSWTYHQQGEQGKPYFHHLNMPGTEKTITNHRPEDHVWHLGLWFSWKIINEFNFWEPHDNAQTKVISETVNDSDKNAVVINTTLAYAGEGKELLKEKRIVTVKTADNGNYTIDWDATFTPMVDKITLEATPVKKNNAGIWASGGYGGLSIRVGDKMQVTCTDGLGHKDVLCCGEKSEKIELNVKHPINGDQAKVTFQAHPENPRYPATWFVRHNPSQYKGRGYYFMGPALMFYEPYSFEKGSTLHLRYTITVEK
jgi:hypothetical protein